MNAPANTAAITTLRQQSAIPREAQLPAVAPGFGSLQSFELMQRAAKLLSSSTLVPAQYRAHDDKKGDNPNALANCVVALNMSQRMGADPLMVMQNLFVVEGRPSWSAQWVIAAINGCGRFSPLRFDIKDLGEKEVEYETSKWVNRERVTTKHKARVRNLECVAWANEKDTGERVSSPAVSIEMAVKEGWHGKSGSKWQTMPEVMLRYRTASFFGKLYAPELLMGLQTVEEMQDIVFDARPDEKGVYTADIEELKAGQKPGDEKPRAEEKQSAAETEDAETGEIVEPKPEAPETQQAKADSPITLDDALAHVKSGDFDLALDLARGLSEAERKTLLEAIGKAQAATKASRRKPPPAFEME